MKIEIKFNKPMKEYQIELLDADLHHLQKKLKKDIVDNLESLRTNRGAKFKLMGMVKRISNTAKMDAEITESQLIYFSGIDLLTYEIDSKEGIVDMWVDVNDQYFDLNTDITKFLMKASGITKGGMVKKIKGILNDEYRMDSDTYDMRVDKKKA